MIRKFVRLSVFLLLCSVCRLSTPTAVFAQALLENPQPGSFQSGIGLVSGWACQAERIDIEITGSSISATIQAAYGTVRGDTAGTCGDSNNGFGILVNWNLLPDGNYTVRALRDNTEFAKVTVIVSTLGLNKPFATGLEGESLLPNFPQDGQTTRLRWQESIQNFSIIGATESPAGDTPSSPRTKLENPLSGSGQSGLGVISGWACEASRIDVEIDGAITLQAAYGTVRGDTAEVCGDSNNGFGLLVNWNELSDGVHKLRVLKDNVEFASSTFTVTSLGLGKFVRGLSGGFVVADFPETDRHTRVQWQESMQNFAITGAVSAQIDEGLCTTATQDAADPAGGKASFIATNPCQSRGQIQVIQVKPQSSATLSTGLTRQPWQQTTGGFLACDSNLSIAQGRRTFTNSDFDWLDTDGNKVCRTVAQGSQLDTFIRAKADSELNFNLPFDIIYTNQRVFQWSSVFLPSPTVVDNDTVDGGPPLGCSLFGVASNLQFCDGSTPTGPKFFTLISQCPIFLEGTVTIIADNNDFRVIQGKTFFLTPPRGAALIGIEYTGTCPATSRGLADIALEGTGVALVLLNPVDNTPR